ncbi:Fic family protein [Thermoproteota archaeon]
MINFKAGAYKQQYQYRSFSPSLINRSFIWKDEKINVLLEKAVRFLGELNAYSTLIPDIDFFIRMHVIKEATATSKIEGTKTNMDEALLSKEDVSPEKRDDWLEVHNYIEAMNEAIIELNKLPLTFRLLKKAHKNLLKGVRGNYKNPGEIRRSQNWIGGSSLQDAFYIPPNYDALPNLLSDLEKFWHNENIDIPEIIKIAISHYQFETIHPFLDGNGRIGRLLITLHLVEKGMLEKPTLYLSDFFEKNKGSYYDSLTLVRTSNNIEQWIKFFLTGVIKTAQSSILIFRNIIKLRKKIELQLVELGRQQKLGHKFLKIAYSKPVFTASELSKILNITFPTANSLISKLKKLGIVEELTGFSRNRLFVFKEYLDLFK